MNPYLEKQLPLLGDLHKKLGLCQQDLDTDLEAINDAIKRAIDEAIGRRKESVQKLEEDVDQTRTEIRSLRRVLNTQQEEGIVGSEPVVSLMISCILSAFEKPCSHSWIIACVGPSGFVGTA